MVGDEVWLEIASRLRYVHGTTSKFEKSIRKYGLLPRKVTGNSVYSGHLESKCLDCVYLSVWSDSFPGFAHVAAQNAVEKFGGEPILVDVKLDKEDLKRFVRDEDSWSEDSYKDLFKDACNYALREKRPVACMDEAVLKVIEEAVKEGKLSKEEACNPPWWFREIACLNKFAIKGRIPPEKIVGIRKLKKTDSEYEWVLTPSKPAGFKTKEEYFLVYNKDEIFKNLIAIEGHLRNVGSGHESGDLSCIVKHAADAEGHADEATSHSLAVEGEEASKKFRQLRDMIREFRWNIQRGKLTPEEAIREVRRIRRFFESFNPLYDISKCKTCGPLPEVEKLIEKLKSQPPSFRQLEEDMARKVIKALSEKYNVEPPKLEILDSCSRPDFGLYHNGVIRMCRGGVSLRVLTHEFGHYLQEKLGLPLDESEAERFSIETIKKDLYGEPVKFKVGDSRLEVKDVAMIYGSLHVAKGISRAAEYLDAQYPGAILGQDPSLIIDLIGTAVGIAGPLWLKLPRPYDMLSALIGGYLSTDLWRHAERMAAPATVRFVPVKTQETSGPSVKASTPAQTVTVGRYRVTG